MGKQTQRQKAKKARDSTIVEDPSVNPSLPNPETNQCCLPHCEEPGEKLLCGHVLCGMDLLKLARYAESVAKFMVICPMCRRILVMEDKVMASLVDKMPFRCAIFKCYCDMPDCPSTLVGAITPCISHKNYSCNVCTGLSGACFRVKSLNNCKSFRIG